MSLTRTFFPKPLFGPSYGRPGPKPVGWTRPTQIWANPDFFIIPTSLGTWELKIRNKWICLCEEWEQKLKLKNHKKERERKSLSFSYLTIIFRVFNSSSWDASISHQSACYTLLKSKPCSLSFSSTNLLYTV